MCCFRLPVEGVTHLDKNTQVPGFSSEGTGMRLGKEPRAFLFMDVWEVLREESLTLSCNFAEGIENAEILQAVPSSEGDAFELTVSCQGG